MENNAFTKEITVTYIFFAFSLLISCNYSKYYSFLRATWRPFCVHQIETILDLSTPVYLLEKHLYS